MSLTFSLRCLPLVPADQLSRAARHAEVDLRRRGGAVDSTRITDPSHRDVEIFDDASSLDPFAVAEFHRLRGVRVLDESEVVAPFQGCVRGGSDAPIGRGPGQDEVGLAELVELLLEGRLLE